MLERESFKLQNHSASCQRHFERSNGISLSPAFSRLLETNYNKKKTWLCNFVLHSNSFPLTIDESGQISTVAVDPAVRLGHILDRAFQLTQNKLREFVERADAVTLGMNENVATYTATITKKRWSSACNKEKEREWERERERERERESQHMWQKR